MREPRRRGFPWLVLLLLAASIYVFWVLPRQLPDKPVQVEFVPSKAESAKAPQKGKQETANQQK